MLGHVADLSHTEDEPKPSDASVNLGGMTRAVPGATGSSHSRNALSSACAVVFCRPSAVRKRNAD
jgi:hypothetical protein